MKYRTAFAMALAALILTACAAEPAAGITPAAESAAPAVTTQEPPAAAVASGKPLYILNSGGTAPQFAITDTAAYLPMKFGATLLATKIDFATAQQQVLCSVDGCSHVDAGCPAFMAADDDALSQYYTGGLVAAGDRLYWFINGGASPVNVRVDVSALDGSNRHTIVENGSIFQLDCTMSMCFTDGDALYLATAASSLVRLDDTGLTSVFPLNDGHPTPENPLYTQDNTPRCTILGCWQDMAVFACTPSLSGSGTGLIGVHADGSVTDLGSYSIDFGSPTDWISTLHDGKLYYVQLHRRLADLVALVDSQHNGLAAAHQHAGDVLVLRGHTGRKLGDHDDAICGIDGQLGLLTHVGQQAIVDAGLDTAGIHQQELVTAPFAVTENTVAGNAGGVFDNSETLAGQFIENCGFAHVGAAHNGYDRFCHISFPPSSLSS